MVTENIMIILQDTIKTHTWIDASWDKYLQLSDHPDYEKAKFYYNKGKLRIEMSPLGHDHACDHNIIAYGINLYASLKDINLNGHDNCTYRKTGSYGLQPDLSYYIGDNVNTIAYGTTIINLDDFPPPDLVVEIANSSLSDDKGEKRLLYEDLGIKEYWIVDVQNVQIIAFSMANGGSFRIKNSQVLANLDINLLEEALKMTRQSNHSKVGAWLLKQWQ